MKTYRCYCEKWKDNIKKLDSIFDWSHIHGLDYDGDEFLFCPWCGLMLDPVIDAE